MEPPTLVIGTPNTSSWSLRPWLVLGHFEIAFEEIVIELRQPETRQRILRHSPAGHVPVLKTAGLVIWESLAIIEYLAEAHPDLEIWPPDPLARAEARALAAEMHAGFAALRDELPVDIVARHPGLSRSAAAAADIQRINEIWENRRGGPAGGFLFGGFSAVDAMFAPVVSRFVTYDVSLAPRARRYRDLVWNLPAMRAWRRKAGEAEN